MEASKAESLATLGQLDQLSAVAIGLSGVIASYYLALVKSGVPEDKASTFAFQFQAAMLQKFWGSIGG